MILGDLVMFRKMVNMLSSKVFIKVRYQETDQMGVVYHGNYFTWFEVSRIELLDQLGCRYRDLEKEGFMLPVLHCEAKFLMPARFDDSLEVIATIGEIPRARITISYEVTRGADLLARGQTVHAFTDTSGKLVRPPERFLQAFSRHSTI